MEILVVILVLILLFRQNSDQPPKENYARASYFGGGVAVEYQQTLQHDRDDFVTFRFYEPGYYQIRFSVYDAGKRDSANTAPPDFDTSVTTFTREIVIKRHILPDYLRIRIIGHNGDETHDFR